MHVYDVSDFGWEDEVVHSVYIFKSVDDFVEFGWAQAVGLDEDAWTFAAKKFLGDDLVQSGYRTPILNIGTDHTVMIEHNPGGGADNRRFEFTVDGSFWGFYNQANISSGGAVVAGAENFDSCEDLRTHAFNMDKQLIPGGGWSDWGTPIVSSQDHTKWWWNEGSNPPPDWQVHHCSTAWCPDDM